MDEITVAKQAVLKAALGICAIPEAELYQRLELLYWEGFKAGLGDEHKGESHAQHS